MNHSTDREMAAALEADAEKLRALGQDPGEPRFIPANDRIAYGVDDAAEAMSVGKSTVWRWIQEGKLATKKIGGRTLIPRAELLRFLDAA